MAAVSIRNVRKPYGTMPIIVGVSLDIPNGEFVIPVGPSGCGKSMFLRMIAGLGWGCADRGAARQNRAGDTLRVMPAPGSVHLFDEASEKRLAH